MQGGKQICFPEKGNMNKILANPNKQENLSVERITGRGKSQRLKRAEDMRRK